MARKEFDDLVAIMARLRGTGGCPWDRLQTRESLKPFLIEETYEILEALETGDDRGLQEELGDLFFHIVFMARIAPEEGSFDIYDVVRGVGEKMIRRHPHVFGASVVSSPGEVQANWAKLKADEKARKSLLDGIPRHLPALMRAYRVTQRTAELAVEPESSVQVWRKLKKKLREVGETLENENSEKLRDELGNILFSLVNLAQSIGVDPEDALRRATDQFVDQFEGEREKVDEGRETVAPRSR